VRTLFIDDLDGSVAEGTIRFGLDGTEYEIDLNAEHAAAAGRAGGLREDRAAGSAVAPAGLPPAGAGGQRAG